MYRKKLIEGDMPIEMIGEKSVTEKKLVTGHPRTLHMWWSRKSLSVARAMIFASLVDDPDDPHALPAFVEACKHLPAGRHVQAHGDTPRMRLFDFLEQLMTWNAPINETVLATARFLITLSTEGNLPQLVDPFAGGGSIPLEALRLGLSAQAGDFNPVAALINKAQIEIPQRFADTPSVSPLTEGEKGSKGLEGLAADLLYYSRWITEEAWKRIGHLYPMHEGKPVVGWVWARTVKSPYLTNPLDIPLTTSFVMSKTKGQECWAKPVVSEKGIRYEIVSGKPPSEFAEGTMLRRKGARCLITQQFISFDYLRSEGQAGRMKSAMMGFMTGYGKSRRYHSPNEEQVQAATARQPVGYPEGETPRKAQSFSVRLYGLDEFAKLHTQRQLVMLNTFTYLIHQAREKAFADAVAAGLPDDSIPLRERGKGARAYSEALSVYLAFVLDKMLDHHSSLTPWHYGQAGHIFTRHAVQMSWNYFELNPFTENGGVFVSYAKLVAACIKNLPTAGVGIAELKSATDLSEESAMISTDPPYYDLINYSDLSDVFYVWLKRLVGDIYPDMFVGKLTPKEGEMFANKHRYGGKEGAFNRFQSDMQNVFAKMRQSMHPQYPHTVYYAFKSVDRGWEGLLSAMMGQFMISAVHPIRTEILSRTNYFPGSVSISLVFVLRPKPDQLPLMTVETFGQRIDEILASKFSLWWGIRYSPEDILQALIGEAAAVYSQHTIPMTIKEMFSHVKQRLQAYYNE